MKQDLTVYNQLGLLIAEALGYSIEEEEDRMAAIKASHARVKAKKDPASVA
jgi:hypothetical protein